MAKSDLLKEAIADAKAVKETAIANAKIALQEAFAPRIQSMLSTKLSEELGEDELEMASDEEMDVPAEPGMEDMDMEPGMEDEVGLDVTIDDPSTEVNPDFAGTVGPAEDDMDAEMDVDVVDDEMSDADMDAEMDAEMGAEEDLDLEEIIRELEEGMYEDEEGYNEAEGYVEEQVKDEAGDDGDGFFTEAATNEDQDISAIIEAILAEEDEAPDETSEEPADESKEEVLEGELNEAHSTIKQLRSVINEVNLLNAKLLYTNKLFRNFELNESQKMKVIENFDRAANTREVKLVFSTLAESFNKPKAKRRIVKESYASKPAPSTAPSKETKKQIISEGNELASRWKKLAGLI